MKKFSALLFLLLCCAVLLTACKPDDPKNGDPSHSGDTSVTDASQAPDPRELLTPEEQSQLFITAKEVIEASFKQTEANTQEVSSRKILSIEWVAGSGSDFVVCVTSFLAAEVDAVTEKTVVKNYHRIQQQDGIFKIAKTEFNTENGILDGLLVLEQPMVREYETLTVEEQWEFHKKNGILSVIDLLSMEKIAIPFHVNDTTGVIRYDYAFMGSRLVAVRADDFGVQFAFSENGKNWTVSTVEVTAEHFFEDIHMNFANDSVGIITANVDRQMGYYGHTIYVTADGGQTWSALADNIGVSRAFYSAAISENGSIFISYNNLSDKATNPTYYISLDYGKSWVRKTIYRVPEMKGFYNTVSDIYFEGANGTLYLTGGEYDRAKFVSSDNGLTWSFEKEIKNSQNE